jgi:hypothetical protein
MTKRIIFGSITGVIAIIALVFYFVKETEPIVDSIFRAVPLDAALIVDIKNFEEFQSNLISDNQLWNELSGLPIINKFNNQLRIIDSVRRSNQILKTLLQQNHSVLITGHPSGKDDIQLIYYLKIANEKDFRQIDKLIKSFENSSIEYSSHNYEHTTIRDIVFAEKKNENFSYAWSHGILILSHSSIMVEDAIRQLLASESILQQKGMSEIVKTAGKNALANFYLNFQYFPRLGLKMIHPKFSEELNFIKNFGNWLELDLNLKSDMLILNGFSFTDESSPGFEFLFKKQKPQKLEIFNTIPAQVSTFAAFGISSLDLYLKNYQLFLESHSKDRSFKSSLQTLKNDYSIDLIKSFSDIFDKEAGIAFIEGREDTLANKAFSIIRTKNKEDAEDMLNSFISEYLLKNNSHENLVLETAGDNNSKLKIWQLPFGNIPALLFGQMFSANKNAYCTLVNNYIIFGNSPEALVYYKKALSQGSLGTDLDFNNFSEYFASQSNFFFYNNPSLSNNFYTYFLKQDIIYSIALQRENFSKMKALVYQFNISDNDLIYNNIFVKYSTTDSGKLSKTTWEATLDANMVGKPYILKSFANNPSEIFVQDSKNQVYLINNVGRILWKTKIEEPIMSDIHEIDFYKNGKLQILFNTRTRLYILDRKGNSVEAFPVSLLAPATNGLALFDYDKNRNYRIFLAGNDKKIYAYDKNGKTVEGWNPESTESEVTKPVQHFRIEGKDLLVFNDQNCLYIIDRKGNEIMKTSKSIPISLHNETSLINSHALSAARFVLSDTTGKVYFISLTGAIKEMDFGQYPANHWLDVYDMNGDGVKDLIFTWNNSVKVLSQKNKALFEITLDQPIAFRPGFYEFSTYNYKIGIVNAENSTIYLYDRSGTLYKDFPIKGNTQFSIDLFKNSENRFNLIVGSNNNFLYQYSVQ